MQRDAETVRRILDERAEALARPLEPEERSELVGTVTLAVAGERYAAELRDVISVERVARITPLPGTPAFWAGLADVRGTMYPVLDLREYLGIAAPQDVAAPGTLVLVSAGRTPVALLCDEASDVSWVRRLEIAAPPRERRTGRAVVRGVTPDMVAVLNLEALLADPALIVDDDAA